jgi:hypothetical protein
MLYLADEVIFNKRSHTQQKRKTRKKNSKNIPRAGNKICDCVGRAMMEAEDMDEFVEVYKKLCEDGGIGAEVRYYGRWDSKLWYTIRKKVYNTENRES